MSGPFQPIDRIELNPPQQRRNPASLNANLTKQESLIQQARYNTQDIQALTQGKKEEFLRQRAYSISLTNQIVDRVNTVRSNPAIVKRAFAQEGKKQAKRELRQHLKGRDIGHALARVGVELLSDMVYSEATIDNATMRRDARLAKNGHNVVQQLKKAHLYAQTQYSQLPRAEQNLHSAMNNLLSARHQKLQTCRQRASKVRKTQVNLDKTGDRALKASERFLAKAQKAYRVAFGTEPPPYNRQFYNQDWRPQ